MATAAPDTAANGTGQENASTGDWSEPVQSEGVAVPEITATDPPTTAEETPDTESPATTKLSTTTATTAKPGKVVSALPVKVSTTRVNDASERRAAAPDPRGQPARMADHEFALGEYTWQASQDIDSTVFVIELPTALMKAAYAGAVMAKNFAMLKTNFCIRVSSKQTPQQGGALVVMASIRGAEDLQVMYNAGQRVILHNGCSEAQLYIPFESINRFYDIMPGGISEVNVYALVLAPLTYGPSGSASTTINVYGRFVDPAWHAPTSAHNFMTFTAGIPYVDTALEELIQKFGYERIAALLSQTKSMQEEGITDVVEDMLPIIGTVEKGLGLLGFLDAPPKHIVQDNCAVVDAPVSCYPLGDTWKMMAAHFDTENFPAGNCGSLIRRARIFTPVSTFTIDANRSTVAPVASWALNPLAFEARTVSGTAPNQIYTVARPSHLAVVANCFQYWRGSIAVRITYYGAVTHKCDFTLTFKPGVMVDSPLDSDCLSWKLTLSDSVKTLEAHIPFMCTRKACFVGSVAPIPSASLYNETFTGILQLYADNFTATSSMVASNGKLVLEVAAGPDFQLFGIREGYGPNGGPPDYFVNPANVMSFNDVPDAKVAVRYREQGKTGPSGKGMTATKGKNTTRTAVLDETFSSNERKAPDNYVPVDEFLRGGELPAVYQELDVKHVLAKPRFMGRYGLVNVTENWVAAFVCPANYSAAMRLSVDDGSDSALLSSYVFHQGSWYLGVSSLTPRGGAAAVRVIYVPGPNSFDTLTALSNTEANKVRIEAMSGFGFVEVAMRSGHTNWYHVPWNHAHTMCYGGPVTNASYPGHRSDGVLIIYTANVAGIAALPFSNIEFWGKVADDYKVSRMTRGSKMTSAIQVPSLTIAELVPAFHVLNDSTTDVHLTQGEDAILARLEKSIQGRRVLIDRLGLHTGVIAEIYEHYKQHLPGGASDVQVIEGRPFTKLMCQLMSIHAVVVKHLAHDVEKYLLTGEVRHTLTQFRELREFLQVLRSYHNGYVGTVIPFRYFNWLHLQGIIACSQHPEFSWSQFEWGSWYKHIPIIEVDLYNDVYGEHGGLYSREAYVRFFRDRGLNPEVDVRRTVGYFLTGLDATTIEALLMRGGIEPNPGPEGAATDDGDDKHPVMRALDLLFAHWEQGNSSSSLGAFDAGVASTVRNVVGSFIGTTDLNSVISNIQGLVLRLQNVADLTAGAIMLVCAIYVIKSLPWSVSFGALVGVILYPFVGTKSLLAIPLCYIGEKVWDIVQWVRRRRGVPAESEKADPEERLVQIEEGVTIIKEEGFGKDEMAVVTSVVSLAAAVGLPMTGVAEDRELFASVWKSVALARAGITSSGHLSSFLEGVTALVVRFKNYFTYGSFAATEIAAWYDSVKVTLHRCIALHTEIASNWTYENFNATNSTIRGKYYEFKTLMEMISPKLGTSEVSAKVPMYRTMMTDLSKWSADIAAKRSGAKDRREPVVLYLYGPAGSGKTTLAAAIAGQLVSIMGYPVGSVYSRCHNEHWDGYTGQKIILIDDLFAESTETRHVDFWVLASSTPFTPARASLEEKGGAACPDFVIVTSNTRNPIPPNATCSAAFSRRLEVHVGVTPSAAYAKGKVLDMAKVSRLTPVELMMGLHLNLLVGEPDKVEGRQLVPLTQLMEMLVKKLHDKQRAFDSQNKYVAPFTVQNFTSTVAPLQFNVSVDHLRESKLLFYKRLGSAFQPVGPGALVDEYSTLARATWAAGTFDARTDRLDLLLKLTFGETLAFVMGWDLSGYSEATVRSDYAAYLDYHQQAIASTDDTKDMLKTAAHRKKQHYEEMLSTTLLVRRLGARTGLLRAPHTVSGKVPRSCWAYPKKQPVLHHNSTTWHMDGTLQVDADTADIYFHQVTSKLEPVPHVKSRFVFVVGELTPSYILAALVENPLQKLVFYTLPTELYNTFPAELPLIPYDELIMIADSTKSVQNGIGAVVDPKSAMSAMEQCMRVMETGMVSPETLMAVCTTASAFAPFEQWEKYNKIALGVAAAVAAVVVAWPLLAAMFQSKAAKKEETQVGVPRRGMASEEEIVYLPMEGASIGSAESQVPRAKGKYAKQNRRYYKKAEGLTDVVPLAVSVQKKVYYIQVESKVGVLSYKTEMNCSHIADGWILANAHLMREHEGICDLTLTRETARGQKLVYKWQMPVDDVYFCEVGGRRTDVCYIPCGKKLGGSRLFRHFVKRSDVMQIYNRSAILVTEGPVEAMRKTVVTGIRPEKPVSLIGKDAYGRQVVTTAVNAIGYSGLTTGGMCGGLIVLDANDLTKRIAGIHTGASDGADDRSGQLVTFEDLSEFLEQRNETSALEEQVSEDEDSSLADGELRCVGQVEPEDRVHSRENDRYFPTPYSGKYYPVVKVPSATRGTPDPVEKASRKFTNVDTETNSTIPGFYDYEAATSAFEFLCDRYIQHMHTHVGTRLRVLTMEEAINGSPECGVPPLNLDTSPGIPWVNRGITKKSQLFAKVDGKYVMGPELQSKVNKLQVQLSKGLVPLVRHASTLKAELLPLAKVAAGKARLFDVPPIELVILARKEFGALCGLVSKHWHSNIMSAVGVNENVDWTKLWRSLESVSDQGFDLDYSAFDATIPAQASEYFEQLASHLYDNDSRTRRGLINMLTNVTRVISFNDQSLAYVTTHGNPSGSPLTTVYNTFVNAFNHCYAYAAIQGVATDWKVFSNSVVVFTYGDDAIVSVRPELLAQYNRVSVAQALAPVGFKCTGASKEDSVTPSASLADLTFLKRSFVKDKSGFYMAPLPRDTIQSLFNFCTDRSKVQLADNLECAVRLSFHSGREYFHEVRKNAMQAGHDAHLVLTLPLYDDLYKKWLSENNASN